MSNELINAGIVRLADYRPTGYVGAPEQVVVFRRRVNSTPSAYSVKVIYLITPDIGVAADVLEDMLVLVYHENTTILKGRLRVAAGGATGTSLIALQVNEFNQGTLDLRAGDTVAVVNEYPNMTKLVSDTDVFNPDSRIIYSDQHDHYKPVANGGGDWSGNCDRDPFRRWLYLPYATVYFDFTTSFNPDPASTQTFTVSIDYLDGTIYYGSTTSIGAVVQFPYGFRILNLKITDATTGKFSFKRIRVDVYHPTLRPALDIECVSLDYDSGNAPEWSGVGWKGTFRGPASLARLPPYSPITYWEDELYDNQLQSFNEHTPAPARGHIKCVLYLVSETVAVDETGTTVTFDAVGPMGILAKIGALPQLLLRKSNPGNWQEFKGLTYGIALEDALFWHTSMATFIDFLMLDNRSFSAFIVEMTDDSNLAAQLRDMARSIQLRVTADRLGRILFLRDPNLMPLTERGDLVVAWNLTSSDILKIEFQRNYYQGTKFFELQAISAGTTVDAQKAYFSWSPGNAPGEGAASEVIGKMIVMSQTDCDRLSGEVDAQSNGKFWDEYVTHAIYSVPQDVPITLRDDMAFIDPAYLEFVSLIFTAERGIDYQITNKWLFTALSIKLDGRTGERNVTGRIAHETHGVPGVPHYYDTATGLGVQKNPTYYSPGYGVLPPSPPIAAFTPVPPVGDSPLLVNFVNQSTGDVAGGFLWDFGDSATSEDANPQHEYVALGTYTVTLTATASWGATDSVSHPVTVVTGAGAVIPAVTTPNGFFVTAIGDAWYTDTYNSTNPHYTKILRADWANAIAPINFGNGSIQIMKEPGTLNAYMFLKGGYPGLLYRITHLNDGLLEIALIKATFATVWSGDGLTKYWNGENIDVYGTKMFITGDVGTGSSVVPGLAYSGDSGATWSTWLGADPYGTGQGGAAFDAGGTSAYTGVQIPITGFDLWRVSGGAVSSPSAIGETGYMSTLAGIRAFGEHTVMLYQPAGSPVQYQKRLNIGGASYAAVTYPISGAEIVPTLYDAWWAFKATTLYRSYNASTTWATETPSPPHTIAILTPGDLDNDTAHLVYTTTATPLGFYDGISSVIDRTGTMLLNDVIKHALYWG